MLEVQDEMGPSLLKPLPPAAPELPGWPQRLPDCGGLGEDWQETQERLPGLTTRLDHAHSGLRPTGHLQPYLTCPWRAPEPPWPSWMTPELERPSVMALKDTRVTT